MRFALGAGAGLIGVALAAAGCGDGTAQPAATTSTSTPTAAPDRSPRVAISPRQGTRQTRFELSITPRRATGVFGQSRHSYLINVRAARSQIACVKDQDASLPAGPAGTRVKVRIGPAGKGGHLGWCGGLFRGTVTYFEDFACPDKGVCRPPRGFPRREDVVARFTFRVRR